MRRNAFEVGANVGATESAGNGYTMAVGLLARAVQRHRLYPASSPLCQESVEACLSAFKSLPEVVIELRVSPTRIDHASGPIPASPVVTELAERLFRADIEELSLRRETPSKELSRFCQQLATWDRRPDLHESFAETLSELGVSSIRARSADKADVLDLEILTAERMVHLAEERHARAPEDQRAEGESRRRAWIQVDTDCDVESIDLVDLAFLLDNQGDLARVLCDIAEGGPPTANAAEALSQSMAELIELYGSLSPRIAEQRFSELAHTLMTLDERVRTALTRDVLLPDLLETGKAARLLRLLPEREILEAVRTLAELEVGAPGLVKLALDRLALPGDRRNALSHAIAGSIGTDETRVGLAPDAPSLQGDGTERDLREYTAYQLSVDRPTAAQLGRIAAAVEETDRAEARLRCWIDLVRHIRNPDHAEEILSQAGELLRSRISSRSAEAADWIRELRAAGDAIRELRPEVAEVVDDLLSALCSPDFIRSEARTWTAADESTAESQRLLRAFGPVSVEALIELLEEEEARGLRRRLVDFMCENAAAFAPGLGRYLTDDRWTVVRNAARVMGFAGPGRESELASLVGHAEERVSREALLALARIGSLEAIDLITDQLGHRHPVRRAMAEESLQTLSVEEGRRQVHRLLGDSDFFRRYPALARRLVRRFAPASGRNWEGVLRPMLSARFRFWQPRLMVLGWAAAGALRGRHR